MAAASRADVAACAWAVVDHQLPWSGLAELVREKVRQAVGADNRNINAVCDAFARAYDSG